MIQLSTNRTEIEVINKIAARAVAMAKDLDVDYTFNDAQMDIEACHCNGCPLRLLDLLNAGDGDFGHDVFGIRRHINRSTGKIDGGIFDPRYSQPALQPPLIGDGGKKRTTLEEIQINGDVIT